MAAIKRTRITIRPTLRVKAILQQAADYAGVELNKFIIDAANENAERIIARETMIKVTEADARMLLAMLDNRS